MSKLKCCSGTCPNPVTATCPWRLFRIEEGQRVYTGRKCDLPLCETHSFEVATKPLCAWHAKIAGEMGYE